MKDKNSHTFASAFKDFLKSENLEQTFQEKQFIQSWEELMGKTIASRTSKLTIRNGILYVELTSAPLRQEMVNSRGKVLELIHSRFGPDLIKEVRIN